MAWPPLKKWGASWASSDHGPGAAPDRPAGRGQDDGDPPRRRRAGAGGFYSEEVREQGRRIGFRLVSLNGTVGTLASVNKTGPYRVGKYVVHLAAFEQVGVQALCRAIEQPQVSVIVIDEIGKMEVLSDAFRTVVLEALDSPKTVLGTVMRAAEPWVDAIKSRPEVALVEVTPANRQVLPRQILDWLRSTSARSVLA